MSGMSDVSMTGSGESFGVLILGMHRSGTSALSAAFAAAGFDPGARVVGGSTGNEDGHWKTSSLSISTNPCSVGSARAGIFRSGCRWTGGRRTRLAMPGAAFAPTSATIAFDTPYG